MKDVVILEVIYPHPPERVWRAIQAARDDGIDEQAAE